ncbi:cobalamin (vitamin B12) biosynthesis CbiM protein [Cellulomonas flavigena DSM 20109]|uniref:Cobalamin (Vitamin B12) biosynthesis CbiM protein n=1 Tax=Cellulomonas flavigena (strain ATCC 482 / DSM 20109 / BCRC 11376 / JCM 18109 / NBRC 3775 / NCIMB 8073 / NRS 134) TaxID=446466 RepID=D5UJA1_CELFN|nr:energy-coupling factor ABC transporter permease [Cellulomonas flavigena]ADG73624.1 cobalamin (vitamin B12) biosynthesis CbiM protein [Cellulomonas flavigena DSM 20109]
MHVPDQYLSDPVSAVTAVVAGAAVAGAAVHARRAGHAPHPALVGATTAAVFGLQMLNYPVAAGTSGHLLGGALTAALLGPAWGVLSVTVVLAVQALVFADGGLTALGTNTLLMAVVGTLVGWAAARGVLTLLRRGEERARAGRAAGAAVAPCAAAAGGAAGVVAAAAAFVALYALGGTVPVATGALTGQMLGVHLLVGVGEAVITGAVVAVVVALRPEVLALTATPGDRPEARVRSAALVPAGALAGVAVLAAVALSPLASAAPDGLEATAERVGFAGAARDHALAGAPLADYGDAGGILVGVAGVVGVVACLALAAALARAVVGRRSATCA